MKTQCFSMISDEAHGNTMLVSLGRPEHHHTVREKGGRQGGSPGKALRIEPVRSGIHAGSTRATRSESGGRLPGLRGGRGRSRKVSGK